MIGMWAEGCLYLINLIWGEGLRVFSCGDQRLQDFLSVLSLELVSLVINLWSLTHLCYALHLWSLVLTSIVLSFSANIQTFREQGGF